jgi:hypothetical protein
MSRDKRRPSAAGRGYTAAWRKARAAFLVQHPWCELCAKAGNRTPATVVDHRTPHRGDMRLFWDRSLWSALCGFHHNSIKQAADRLGPLRGCDEYGNPRDPNHPFYRKE